jgi:hypothetical protein
VVFRHGWFSILATGRSLTLLDTPSFRYCCLEEIDIEAGTASDVILFVRSLKVTFEQRTVI